MTIEQKLIDLGGNLWESGNHRRIYLNNWLELAGVNVSRYQTGNISSASINGKKISNAKAAELDNVKAFWDCSANALVFQGSARMLDDIAPLLKKAIY